MKKLLLFLLISLSYVTAFSQQTAPVNPKQLNQNTVYLEPSTNRRWGFNGAIGWYVIPDSTYIKSFISAGGQDSIAFVNQFKNIGTSTKAIIALQTDTMKTTPIYNIGLDPTNLSLRYDTTLYTPYYVFKATLPDGVISGLGLSIAGSNVLVASGMWRISGNTYTTSGTTTLPIDAQDPTLSRYDVVYGNASNTLNIISGTLSASPVYPSIPGGTILVGAVLITPTSVTTVQPVITNYVTTNTTQTIGAVKTFTQDVLGTFWQILANGMATFQGGVNSPTYNFYGHNAYFTYNAGEIGIGGTDAVSISGPLIKSQLGNNLISFDYSTLKRNTQTGPSTIVTDYFLTQDSVKAGANVTITKSGQSITVAASGGGGGTVTSVGATGSNGILIGGSSPITTSGTYTFQVDSSAYRTVANSLSLAQIQTALNLKANLASPTFTGTPAAPTASPGTNTTQLATTAFVTAAVTAGGVSGANPTASIGFTAVNGSATTYTRSDGAPKADSTVIRSVANSMSLAQLASTYGTITNLALKANIASPTFTGTVTIPTPFTLGATSVTSTGTQLNYLNAATGTTGTTSTNLVYSTSPTLVTPTLGVATATSINGNIWTTGTGTFTQAAGSTLTTTGAFNLNLTATAASTPTFPTGTGTLAYLAGSNTWTAMNTFNRANITTTSTAALAASNTTAATSGVPVQYSPAFRWTGTVWNTSGTPATNNMDALMEYRPASSAAPIGTLATAMQLNGGGYTDVLTLLSNGQANHTGTILATANNQIATGITGSYTFTDGAFTGVVHSAMKLTFGAALGSQFNITDATGTGDVDLHFGNANPSSSNFAFRGNTTNTYLNAPGGSGTVFFRVANTTLMSLPSTGILNLVTAPSTSTADTYDFITRQSSTGNIEKVLATSIPITRASADLTAQTSTGNVTTFTVGASTATFNISQYINITAVSVDVIQGQVTYTDENNTAQTISLSNLSAVGNSTYNPVTIRAKNATVITVKTNLTTGAGSITFDAGARITQL